MPSMPKGETVGNVVIDGKGGVRCRNRNSYKEMNTDNGGSKEEMNIKEKGRGRGSKYGDRAVITAAEEQEAASVKEKRKQRL